MRSTLAKAPVAMAILSLAIFAFSGCHGGQSANPWQQGGCSGGGCGDAGGCGCSGGTSQGASYGTPSYAQPTGGIAQPQAGYSQGFAAPAQQFSAPQSFGGGSGARSFGGGGGSGTR